MASTTAIRRIKPDEVPFSEMPDELVDRLVSHPVFADLASSFRESNRFRKILKTHARVVECEDGGIIIREGDWGNTAFFILSGSVAVEIEPPQSGLPDSMLGRRQVQRKNLWQALAQLWANHRHPEVRGRSSFQSSETRIKSRGKGHETRIYLQDVPGLLERYGHVVLGEGELFGELAALGRSERTATVFAKGPVELLEVRWQGLRDLMRGDSDFRRLVDERFREVALAEFLRNSPIFAHLRTDEEAMSDLVAQTQLETYGEFDRVGSFNTLAAEAADTDLADEPLICREGDHPNGVVMIRNGLARVSHRHHNGHRTVNYLSSGKMFGFEEVVEGWRTGAPTGLRFSLRGIGFLTAVIVPTTLVEKYVLEHPKSSWAGNSPVQSRDVEEPSGPATSQLNQDLLEFLVEHRFVNGTATMLIDLDRCTRCDDCVRACASAHDNNPRFLRHGPRHGNVMVANACMHCQDPVCMIECPTGAISRRGAAGEVTINDDTCIGCGKCSRNCPYDAIRMVEIRDGEGNFIRDTSSATRAPIPKATKCDLCVDQLGGPACQRACPHDALVRLNVTDAQGLAQWHNR